MTITTRDGLSIALKILGFYYIYQAFYFIGTIVSWIVMLSDPFQQTTITKFAMFVPSVIPLILAVATAYVLLKFSDRISEKLIRTDKKIQIFNTGDWQREVFTIALRIFGAYQVATEIATLSYQIMLAPTYQKAVEKESWQNVLYTLICIVIGLYLLTGARHLVNLLFREKKTEPVADKPSA
ncbi:MAG: hypothetical protein AB1599_03475 [Planctomycetota bacterium]